MSTQEVINKFQLLAGKVLSLKSIADLQNAVQNLEALNNINRIAMLLAKY